MQSAIRILSNGTFYKGEGPKYPVLQICSFSCTERYTKKSINNELPMLGLEMLEERFSTIIHNLSTINCDI